MRTTIRPLLAGVLGVLLLVACSIRIIHLSTQAQTRTVTFEASATPKRIYYCEGITKKGERCKRRVKEPGLMCWQHKPKSK